MKQYFSKNEDQRLNALYEYEILDTEFEECFDNIAQIASQICDTPIALISLVDTNRQWFKAKIGLQERETSRDVSFCSHAILDPTEVLVVEDATQDQRFSNNTLVTSDPNIRFYAGAPLITPEGMALGTICVIDTHPRKISKEQLTSLRGLAREVMLHLELRIKVKLLSFVQNEALKSEYAFKNMINISPQLIWTSGRDKKCNYFNQSWLAFTGRTLEQELGFGWTEGVHKNDLDRCLKTYETAFDQRIPFQMEYRLKTKDSEYKWVEDHGKPWFNERGEFQGYIGSCSDISERKETELKLIETSKRFELAVNGSSDGIWDWPDIKKNEQWWSPRLYQLLGHEQDEVEASMSHLIYLLHPHDREKAIQALHSHFEYNEPFDIEYRLKTKSGVYRWFHSRANTERDEEGNAYRMAGSLTDITSRKKAEENISTALKKAEQATATRSQFLANMSHEIRTPLTAMLGFADALLDGSIPAKEKKSILRTIISNGEHLLALINDILDFSKIDAGALLIEKTSFSLLQAIDEIKSLLEPRAVEKGIHLRCEYEWPLPKVIQSDSLRLKQIFINLIGNAIKFTEKGSVWINVSFDKVTNVLSCNVKDSGIGLSESQIENLFKPFLQADPSTSRKFGGTGLGLSISHQLVQMLGGQIYVKSELNKGAHFWFEIPLPDVKESDLIHESLPMKEKITPKKSDEYPTLKGKVLIAEDVRANQRLLEVILKKSGLELTFVENGIQALAATQKESFDLIILDMQMPEMDGYDTATQLRSEGYTVPIVALTANAMREDIDKCIKSGCNIHLGKPFEKDKIFKTLEFYLSGKGL